MPSRNNGRFVNAAVRPITELFIVVALLSLGGCSAGQGSGGNGNSVSVTITNKITSVTAGGAAVAFNATAQNGTNGVTWTLTANGSSCSPSCGSLSGATSISVTYTPPASAPSAPNNQPTVTATSVDKTNKSDSDSFTINPGVTVTISNKFSSVNTGANAFVVNATVQNDSTNSGVTWTLTGASCSATGCGSLTSSTATSVTYNPPTSLPTNTQATLTATSVHDTSKSDSAAFTVTKPPIAVTIKNKVSTVSANAGAISFSASLQNDTTNPLVGVNWSLTVSGTNCVPTCGTLSNQGFSTIAYTPPATAPASPNNRPTLTATSTTDPTKSDTDAFTINPPPAISLTISQVSSVLAGASGVTFDANVQNDSAGNGVTWALTASGSACSPTCGSLSNVGATSVAYTPPASAPASPNNHPTLTATSVTDATKSGSDSFTITSAVSNSCGSAQGHESLLNGHYAVLEQGFEGSGSGTPILMGASFSTNGSGGITGGEEDINDTISAQHLTFTSSGSLYTVGADRRGCLQLTNSSGTTTVFRFSLGGISSGIASRGRIIEFDDNSGNGKGSRGSGILRLQDSNSFVLSALQAQYAFGVDGWDMNDGQLIHFAMAGSFSNSSGTLSNGVADTNDGGNLGTDFTSLTGAITSISATTGRGTGNFMAGAFSWSIYVVNGSEFFIVGTDPLSNVAMAGGRAVVTGSSFAANTLSGNYVVRTAGNTSGNANVNLELLATTPGGGKTGTLSGTVYSYTSGNAQTTTLGGVTYNVDSTSGRVTLGNPSDNLPILYLTTPTDGIAAFVIGVGADAVFGMAEPQTSQSLPLGTYTFGTEDPAGNTVANESGVETIASGGSISTTIDQSDTTGLQSGQSNNTNFSLGSDGSGSIGGNPIAITSGSKLFYIDESSGTAVITVAEQ